MEKWEYKIKIPINDDGSPVEVMSVIELNKHGEDGWELATTAMCSYGGGIGTAHVFKRKKKQEKDK